ncbi:MAG: hypothetical protein JSS96_12880 [Bacteroidetes bacterium]|nr:hypothetical protein [Bacteroidota bacterium]
MKRIVAISLLVFYLLAITGFSIRAHYCGKHLMSWTFNGDGKNCGNCEKESSKKKCCKDKVVAAHVSHEQQHVNPFVLNFQAQYLVPEQAVYIYSVAEKFSSHIQQKLPDANAPPGLWQQIPLYKLHARFTYYDRMS